MYIWVYNKIHYQLTNMYTTPNATREFALKAAAATRRAMERHICCNSQFKFRCFSCGEFINRGDKITKCHRKTNGMTLRYRGADCVNGLTMAETAFYQGESGKNMWVHIGCTPCYRDSLPENSNKYSPPTLRSSYTDWDATISQEFFDEVRGLTRDWNMTEFLEKHGYLQNKFMKDRIIHSVTRFQAIWRGYIFKQKKMRCRHHRCRSLAAEQKFARETSPGDTGAILFDLNRNTEALYSYEIVSLVFHKATKLWAIPGKRLMVYVKFHHDGDMRKYHWEKFLRLRKECVDFMEKMDIRANFVGKIATHHRHRFQKGSR